MRNTASLSLPRIGDVPVPAPESEACAIAANLRQPDVVPKISTQRLPPSPSASLLSESAAVTAFHPRRPTQARDRPSTAFEIARRRRIVGEQARPAAVSAESADEPTANAIANVTANPTESDAMIGATAISNNAVPNPGNRFLPPESPPPRSHRRLSNPALQASQSDAPQVSHAKFFSQYESHFRFATMHFGGEAALRVVLEKAGLKIGEDVQIEAYRPDNSDCMVAKFHNAAAAYGTGHHVVASKEAQHCVDLLQSDAQIASARAVFPRRPSVPLLPADATPVAVIDAVLDRSHGMVVGEAHHGIASKQFLIDHMPHLRAHDVQTLFMEHLLSDDHQAALDAWHASPPGSPMPSVIAAYLRQQDTGHMEEHCVDLQWQERYRQLQLSYCFTTLAQSAQRCGIKIVAADCHASYGVHAGGLSSTAESSKTRTEVMNYFASEKIQRRELPGKWIAFVGNTHANTYHGVPGIAEQTGALAVVVKDRLSDADAPAVRTHVDDFSPGMHLDMVVAMAWND